MEEQCLRRAWSESAAYLQNAVFVQPENEFVRVRQGVRESAGSSATVGGIKMAADFAYNGQYSIGAR